MRVGYHFQNQFLSTNQKKTKTKPNKQNDKLEIKQYKEGRPMVEGQNRVFTK
jgi:hypothetical protein